MSTYLHLQDIESFGYMPKNGIAGSYIRYISSFLRKLHMDFPSGSTSLHPTSNERVIAFLHMYASICLYLFIWIFGILTGARQKSQSRLIFIDPMAKNVRHFKDISLPFVFCLLRALHLVSNLVCFPGVYLFPFQLFLYSRY